MADYKPFITSYSALITEYTSRINIIKQEIRDLMADPVGAGMTSGAFIELIKDPIKIASYGSPNVGYATSDPSIIIAHKCDVIAKLEKAKEICAELDAE